MERITRKINLYYYLIYTLTILTTIIGYMINISETDIPSINSNLHIVLSSSVILYLIISIPLALALFFRYSKKLANIENENEKINKYAQAAAWRLLAIGFGLIFSVVTFYILRSVDMIYCAGISAIALFFCKPTEGKVRKDLNLEEEE